MTAMILWMSLALMTGAAVMAVLWPLSARNREAADASDVGFYKSQLSEVETDVARKMLAPSEAEAVRAEASRRLLRAASAERRDEPVLAEPALRRRRAASALALAIIPLAGLALYGALGSPDLAVGGGRKAPAADDLASALERIETHLAEQPEDGRGWDVVAPVYLRLGRPADAAKAYTAALRLRGETPDRLAGLGEALVASQDGVVSGPARETFERALVLDPAAPKPAYYLALAAEQEGDVDRARAGWKALLARADGQAPWRQAVEGRLAELDRQPSAPPLPAGTVTPEIAAMVAGLDARLSERGGTGDEWMRLIRSFVVLDQRDQARNALMRARIALKGDAPSLDRLQKGAEGLGLRVEEARR